MGELTYGDEVYDLAGLFLDDDSPGEEADREVDQHHLAIAIQRAIEDWYASARPHPEEGTCTP